MDFFASQDTARRQTRWLVFYFILSITVIVIVLYFVACLAFLGAEAQMTDKIPEVTPHRFWRPDLMLFVTLATMGIIGVGSAYKTFELSGGGEQIATLLGGRRLQTNSSDPAERRLLNIVEEMALASGISVPPVFVMDNERGINAFAAGFTPNDAVIGVNRGTIEYLSRDELQGVVAHEFSHIFNGDMRLNLRLIGLLHGILLISIIGYFVMRTAGLIGSGQPRSSRGGKQGGGGALAVLLLGLAMWIIGSLGLLCARLIKAAISRQREFLADASAVQFTRNPDGIAGALKKIGGLLDGSRVSHPEAETASHMFFGAARGNSFAGLLSTHPPLVQRIRRIDPQFDGRFPKVERSPQFQDQIQAEKELMLRRENFTPTTPIQQVMRLSPMLALQSVGNVLPEMVQYTTALIAALPDPVREAIHDPFSGRLVVMIWLLDRDESIRKRQLDIIRRREGKESLAALHGLLSPVGDCEDKARLPMLEILQGTLTAMSHDQYAHFRETVVELVQADNRIVLGEFIMKRILLTHLDRHFGRVRPPTVRYMSLNATVDSIADLLSIMVLAGTRDPNQQSEAYRAGMGTLGMPTVPMMRTRGESSMERLDAALQKIEASSPQIKKRVLAALLATAAHDEVLTTREAELLRAIAVAIDCPLPPLLPGPMEQLATPQRGRG
jgi:Zn-dependent protease with chaperone function